MKSLLDIFERGSDFGKFRSRENLYSFTLKCIFYIIPAIILGIYTDVTIRRIKKNKVLGDNILYYILLQTLINIATLYVFLILLVNYTSEFQVTIAGGFYSVLYFGIQTNYILMIKEYINYN
jgi:hypothetical protein